MSGSNNLPVGIDVSAGFAELDRQVQQLGRSFAAQAAPVATLNTALASTQERLGQMEQGTQRAQRTVNDLRGALELLGASGVAGPLGQVASTMGNFADVLATAGRAGSVFTTAMEVAGRALPPLAIATTAVVVATTDWDAVVDRVRLGLQDLRGVTYDMNRATTAYAAGIEGLIISLEGAEQAERRLAAAQRERMIGEMAAGQVAIRPELEAARRRREEFAETFRQVEQLRAIAGPDVELSPAIQRRLRRYEETNRDVLRLEDQYNSLEWGMRDLRQVPMGQATPAQIAQRLNQRVVYEWRPEANATVFPVDAFPAPRGGGGGGGAARPATIYEDLGLGAGQTVFPTEATSGPLARMEEQRRQAEERARQARERAERESLERVQRANERVTDDITRYVADGFADAMRTTEGNWARLMNSLRNTAISTFARIAADAVIRPIVAPIVSGLGLGTLTGGDGAGGGGNTLGGLGQMLGLGSSLNSLTGGGLMNSLGLGGVGSTIGGWLSAPLWGGTSGLSAAALSGPGGLAALEAAGGAAGGFIAPSFASLLGPAALGAAGGGLLASLTGGNPVGGSIGGALGAGAGFLIGGPLGALIGGAAGGGLGGLFGNSGAGFSGGDALIGRTNDGFLTVTGYAGKGMDGSELTAQARQQVEAINAQLRAANIRVTSGMRANMGGGGSPNPTTALGAIQQFGFGFGSDNPRIAQAIAPFGSNLEGALGVAQWVTQLEQLTNSLDAGSNVIRQVTAQFDAAFETARKYGFGIEEVTRAQNAALGALISEPIGGVADLISGLRLGADSPMSPRARAAANQAEVTRLVNRARGGDLAAYGGIQASAQNAVAALRETYGGGRGYADGVRSLLDTLGEFANASADQLTASLYAATQKAQTDVLSSELQRLRAEVAGLRADLGQATRMPGRLA